jgi:hypothetical protein
MAKPSVKLVRAIRQTATNLEKGAPYEWGHMGSCNCGNLAQELSPFSKKEIHEYAMRKMGDWTEQANDYCPTSGLPFDHLISTMLRAGLTVEDLKNLEKLSDPSILRELPGGERYLTHNKRTDVILYLQTWASILERELRNIEDQQEQTEFSYNSIQEFNTYEEPAFIL